MRKIICAAVLYPLAASAQADELMLTSFYDPPAPYIAAHKALPFGTRLRISNPRTGRSVLVTIRDRGPFVRGRALDISRAYARELGFGGAGVARLKVSRVH